MQSLITALCLVFMAVVSFLLLYGIAGLLHSIHEDESRRDQDFDDDIIP